MQNRKDFFNSLAEEWDDITTHDSDKINTILDSIGIQSRDSILDVGCGTGILVPFLLPRIGNSGKITCIDLAENMIDIARKKHPQKNVTLIAGNLMDIDFTKYGFNRIICYSVFPHLDKKEEYIQRMRALLIKGGTITICHSQSREAINDFHRKKSKAVRHDHLPDAATIQQYFANADMRTVYECDNDEMFVITAQ